MGDNLDDFIFKENFSVPPPDEFSSRLDGLVSPEQKDNLLQKYQDWYKIANGDYRKSQNS